MHHAGGLARGLKITCCECPAGLGPQPWPAHNRRKLAGFEHCFAADARFLLLLLSSAKGLRRRITASQAPSEVWVARAQRVSPHSPSPCPGMCSLPRVPAQRSGAGRGLCGAGRPHPVHAAFPVPAPASTLPVSSLPAAAGDGKRGPPLLAVLPIPPTGMPWPVAPGRPVPSWRVCPQVCHHAECRQLNRSGPLSLCELCDGHLHGAMHFDGHIRFDLPPQGERGWMRPAPLLPAAPQPWDVPGAGTVQRCEWDRAWGRCSAGMGVGCSRSWYGAGGPGTAQLDARLQALSWPATCQRAHARHAPALSLMWRRRRRARRIAEGEPPALRIPCTSPAHSIPITLPSLCPQGAKELGAEAAQEEGLAQAHGRKAPAPLPRVLCRAAAWPRRVGGTPGRAAATSPPRTPARSASL